MRVATDMIVLRPEGGVEACTLEDVTALAGRGHRMDVFFGEDGELRAPFEAVGASLTGPVPFKASSRRFLRDLRSFLPALRAVRRMRPDVIWLNRVEHVVWGTLLARAAGVPLVSHLHHSPSTPRVRWLTRGVRRFIAVSRFEKDLWAAAGIDPARIEVVHNALPPGRYPAGGEAQLRAARAALGLPVDARVITFYGRFSDEKGLPTVIEAFRALDRPDAVLLLAGHYPWWGDTDAVRRDVESLDPARCRVVPASDDVIPFLHAADVVVSPSWVQESFGRTIVEGMSTGRPVIGARIGGMTELLEGGMDRLLVPTRDAPALRAALEDLLDWRATDPGLGERCRRWVEDRFPYDAHLDRLESILRDVARP